MHLGLPALARYLLMFGYLYFAGREVRLQSK